MVFDTGHQAYVHKLLTGRVDGFAKLRQEGGLSGYPSQAESDHDIVENSHASTALSLRRRAGQGVRHPRRGPPRRRRHRRRRAHRRHGLGGAQQHRDRQRAASWSSSSTTTAAPTPRPSAASRPRSTGLRTNPRYEQVLDQVKRRLNAVRGVGPAAYDVLHAMKKGMKDALAPQGLFEDLGLKYVGPVDGHDRAAMEQVLAQAKRFGGPVIVHALTRKGFGYDAAERHEADQFHSPGPFDVDTGEENPKGRIWTDVFADEIVHIGQRRKDVVAITAAMMHPVGLHHFQARFPERTFDVGIAEQHAATSAAGPRHGRPAPGGRGLRDVPQPRLRPGADGLRAAPVRRHVRARPGRRDRRRRRQPQRHVGHVGAAGRARPAAGRAARRHPAARAAQRGGRGRRRADRGPVPEGPAARGHRGGRQGRRRRRAASATAPRTS